MEYYCSVIVDTLEHFFCRTLLYNNGSTTMRLGYFSSGISLDSDLYLNIRIQVTCSIGQSEVTKALRIPPH